jgi:hypothetical protein
VQVGRASRLLVPNNKIASNKSVVQQTGGKEYVGKNCVGATSSRAGRSSIGEGVSTWWCVLGDKNKNKKLTVVAANFSVPVQGNVEAHRKSMQRMEDEKKRVAQSAVSRETLDRR